MSENLEYKRILVTGATGFIGSHLTKKLIEQGFQVGILKRKSSNPWRIKDILNKISIYDVNLRDTDEVVNAVRQFNPDIIFHLAGYYRVEHTCEEISPMLETNVIGTINLLEAARKSSVKLLVNTSTCFVYKNSKTSLREDSELDPLNLYALTKVQGEQACDFYTKKYGLRTVTFRLFPPYGPADNERKLIIKAIKYCLEGKNMSLSTGKQRWDFVFIEDIVQAYLNVLFLFKRIKKHEIFNIGTGNAVEIRKVVSQIKKITGSNIKLCWAAVPQRENEVWFCCADIKKAKTFLKWKPKVQILEEGLQLTVDWYKKFYRRG